MQKTIDLQRNIDLMLGFIQFLFVILWVRIFAVFSKFFSHYFILLCAVYVRVSSYYKYVIFSEVTFSSFPDFLRILIHIV
jgi:hypothetical protein